MRNFSMLALVVVGLVACRGDDTGDDQPMPDGGNTNDVTIQEIQNDAMPACDPANPTTCVELKLKGVVVTAIDTFGNRTGDFWIGEPGGGPYSGVQVYGAPLDQVAALQIGDVVDIAGAQKAEFALSSDTSGNKLTELEPIEGGMMTVTKTGANMPIQPTVVDALAIGQMTDFMARHAEWEKWEGVLVTLSNVEAFSNTTCITSMGNCTDMTYERFDITGDIQVQSSLAAMPTTKVARGDCLSGVTGVMGYFFDYQILPRTTAEIGTGGTACPVENTAATCGDSIDNNGNGFADCMDFSCQQAVPACSVATTVAAVQMGTSTGAITIDEAFVTGRDDIGSSRGLWVADSLTAAQYNGVYVYTGSTSADAAMVIGAKVKVTGNVSEFDVGTTPAGDKLTEITQSTLTFISAPAGLPMPLTTALITTLSDIGSAGEPYEGVLVQLATLKVTNNALGNNKVELTDNNGQKIIMDDDAFGYATTPNIIPAANTCYATVTGVMNVNLFDDLRTFNPRAATDLVVGTGCN